MNKEQNQGNKEEGANVRNIYFVSDAHLGFVEDDVEREKRGKLMDFLHYIQEEGNTGALYLVGDIFDFWFQWYHVIPRYWFPILCRLRQLIEAGIEVVFITGNHDFYTGTFLEREVGLRCFAGQREFVVAGKSFFVAHGDGYAREDRGYRLLKRIIRHPVANFLFKTFIPADWGMQLARWTSSSSRKLVKIEKHSWSEEYYRFAQEKFKCGFDYVVMGHIHLPLLREEAGSSKVYLNCGDWMKHFTYGKYDGNRLSLHEWGK